MKSNLKAVIFDMDGVLIDSMPNHIDAWKKIFAEEKINLTSEEIALNEGRSSKATVELFLKESDRKLTVQEIDVLDNKKKEYTKNFKIVAYKGVKEFIEELRKQGLKTAIVTGSIREFTNKVVKDQFKDLFDVIVTSNVVSHGKPHPAPYLKSVELLKLKKEECLVIENAPLGIESAKGAGLKVYAIETTLDRKYLERADMVFKNHEDLIKYVLNQI
ncbi:MAG: HAD family phosphatase [Candidatus Woesearchaeota archaeon]|jgi:beta-phosphoglucomutase